MRLTAGRAATGAAILWAVLHLAHYGRFIYHDSWVHNFPMLEGLARQAGCGAPPAWLWSPDSGTPTLIYIISTSLTQLLRVPMLLLLGCLDPGIVAAVYLYKAASYGSYFALACGMYVFGRAAFAHRLSAAYLFAATLFAGLALEAAHSDQVVTITFWLPWIAACGLLYHRRFEEPTASRYLNLAALFIALESFDQYPHFALVGLGAAAVIYALLEPRRAQAALTRHGWRLWPGALALALTAGHFLILKDAIAGYAPSLRSGLIVDLSQFSQGGFVQPTAFLGSLLPQTLLSGYEPLRAGTAALLSYFAEPQGTDWFIFPLDELVFHLGVVPLALALVFLLRPGLARLRLGWFLWIAAVLAVSLQQTGLYLLLFRYVPFFDLFRSYFLFSLFGMLGVLVASAYGLDALLTLPAALRRTVLARAGAALALLLTLALAALGTIALFYSDPGQLGAMIAAPLARDLLLVLPAVAAMAYGSRERLEGERVALGFIGALLLAQLVYTSDIYAALAIPERTLIARFGLDRADLAALEPATRADPDAIQRKLCALYAECYLSRRPTVSLRRDLEGTFLRPRGSPVFAPALKLRVVEALSGLTMPLFWTSRRLETVGSEEGLVRAFNAHEDEIAAHLREVAYVAAGGAGRLSEGAGGDAALSALRWERDALRLAYDAPQPVLLNAAISCDGHWHASVNGADIPLACADFAGLLLRLPAGSGELTLRYRDRLSDFVFASRYALLAVAVLGILALCRESGRSGPAANGLR